MRLRHAFVLLALGAAACGRSHAPGDASPDAGSDTGTPSAPDAGVDAGRDAGVMIEADAGIDACTPTAETCNGGDDDCDGVIDEAADLPPCALPNATAACVDGACRPTGCDAGWGDCDGVLANGCETEVEREPAHCGRCGRACDAGVECADGLCADERVVQVTASAEHTCAVRASGQALCWGNNHFGELGTGDTIDRFSPATVLGTDDYVAISAGFSHTCAVRASGAVACWGRNTLGELGDGTGLDSSLPVDVVGITRPVVSVSAASGPNGFTYAIADDGRLWGWGNNYYGQLGPEGMGPGISIAPRSFGPSVVVAASAAYLYGCAVDGAGGVSCWGTDSPTVDLGGVMATQIEGGGDHVCVVDDGGRVFCGGSNADGQVGPAGCMDCSIAESVPLPEPALSVHARGNTSCAILASGTLSCWGDTVPGMPPHAEPRPVVGLPAVVDFSLGPLRRCALDRRARVWCWGLWSIGDGTTDIRNSPVEITGVYP